MVLTHTDRKVKSIFVNIFGGIARCDHIAEAVVAGVKAIGGNDAIKPLVIRLEGRAVLVGCGLWNVGRWQGRGGGDIVG